MAKEIIHVLDDYYLGITALITIGYQLAFFAVAFYFKFDKLTDFAGGTNFVVLVIVTLSLGSSSDGPTGRQLVASALLAGWAARLSGFLFYRILRTGRDDRFDGKRDRFFPFLGFWIFQMLWVWAVSLPVTVLNSPAVAAQLLQGQPQQQGGGGYGVTGYVAGVVMFAVGFVVECVSDAQRFAFRSRNDKMAVCDRGLFLVSRHPNYFGEILLQFGIYSIAVSAAADGHITGEARKALYATVVGPLFITLLLLFVSGLPLSERPGAKKRYEDGSNWDAYARYLNRTSILIPFPPQLYEKLPTFVKRTIFLEFPIYVFDPAKHAGDATGDRPTREGQSGVKLGDVRQSTEGLVD